MSYGQRSQIGISFQDSYGTALQNSIFWLPKVSEDVTVDKPPLIEQNLKGVLDEGQHFEGPNMVAGAISMEAAPIPLGVLLKCVLGEPTTVTSDALFTHTYEPQTADFDELSAGIPLTIEKYLDTGSASLFSDMNGNTLELNIAQGEFMMATVAFVGGTFVQQTATAPVYPAIPLWTWDTTSLDIGGVAKPEIMDMTIVVDETIEAMHTLSGSKFPSRNKRTGFRTMSINGTLKFDNATEFQSFLDQDERELIVHFEGTVAVQSGYNNSLTLKVPLLRYVEFKPVAGGPGEIEVGFSGKGVYSTTSATAFQAVLANGQSGY